MVCPNCNSTDLKKLWVIYAAGLYDSRGRVSGLLLGSGDAVLLGKYRGTSQSRLAKLVSPPRKAPYVAPVILWLMGLFIVIAFAGRGKLSWMMGVLSAGYLFALPTYLLAALLYNFCLHSKKYKEWNGKFMCQRCGTIS
jgi:hypothetical protein